MTANRGVIAAVMAAVNAYLEGEEMAWQAQLRPPRQPSLTLSMWRVSGRDEIMRMRAMWQRRMV